MIEFSTDLNKKYSGKQALEQRVKTRVSHTTSDIPYYERGIDLFEFTYGSQSAALRMGLRDLGVSVSYDSENKRVQVYNVSIDVEKEIS